MNEVYIHSSAHVSSTSKIGRGTKIWHFCHIRENTKIGKNCIIGKDVYIDFGVEIGSNVKIQNGVSIYNGVTIEDDVFLGPHMTFTNDLIPRSFNSDWEVIPTLVKKGASIGAHATIICGVTLGKYCMIGAGSVTTKDVPSYGLIYGNPAKLKGFVCKCGRKAHFKGEKRNLAIYYCDFCKKEFEISISDHKKVSI